MKKEILSAVFYLTFAFVVALPCFVSKMAVGKWVWGFVVENWEFFIKASIAISIFAVYGAYIFLVTGFFGILRKWYWKDKGAGIERKNLID